ncbi:MAG: hypothetical protein R3C11_09615 [Planctomycetaceae bacterium]
MTVFAILFYQIQASGPFLLIGNCFQFCSMFLQVGITLFEEIKKFFI